MEVVGKIKVIESVVEGTFKSRNVDLLNETVPTTYCVQFVQDKCDILKQLQRRSNVKVSINLRGREWINPQGNLFILILFKAGGDRESRRYRNLNQKQSSFFEGATVGRGTEEADDYHFK
jgi:hypothetical protein